jgi:glycosyltransferase involved in cell wall biosynthesis
LKKSDRKRRRVAIIGTRGYPNYYGGFETAVRFIAPALADQGWDVTVYGRRGGSDLTRGVGDERITVRDVPGIDTKALSTLTYGLTATLDAAVRGFDVALIMNVANGYWIPFLRAARVPVLVNVDGLEWERDKWGRVARAVFRLGARFTALFADRLVADAVAIAEYWKTHFDRSAIFIPYGGIERDQLGLPLGLQAGRYVLMVARFVDENTVSEFFQAARTLAEDYKVVIVGSSGYGGDLDAAAERLSQESANVDWLGHVADDDLLHSLWQNAGVYFHGHSVGGTNPALVQAMLLGAPTVARDTVYNREVLGQTALAFVAPRASEIATAIALAMNDSAARNRAGGAAMARARDMYTWDLVVDAYGAALADLLRVDRTNGKGSV